MRKILTAKLGAACMTAENEVQGFQDFEESHLADQRKQREVKPAPLQYSDAHAKNKDELRKLYQLMRFFEAQTNVTPPGLFDVEFASKGWDDAAEKKLRAELRECYLGGMAGKPLSRGYNTADHRAAHSLGFARRYNGSVLATAQTSLAFTSAAGFQAESSLFEGPSVEEMLPCPKDADRTEVRSCATYTGMNEGLQTSEESADADPEDLCRQSGYTANAGAAYYKQPHSAVAGGMLHDGKDSKVTFTQLLSKEGAYIQDCYSAGLSDSPMPPAPTDVPGVDPAILQWKGKYAYAVGLSHRKDVMNSCPVDKTNERGELYVPNSYVQNIERSMTAEKNANGDDLLKLKGFGALLQEMDQVYGALSLELKSGEQALEKEADALRKLNQGYAQWLADKPARDKAARESLEAEEQRKRNEIEQESRTSMGTIQSSFNSSKPRAVPKPVAPKPQPKKPVEAKKKGCCG
ncbi:hypothetical protein DIPPA_22023 [Diplonema papillatum]|nr:hypothetical protein DIPPA_22023 [Diplonema papillatum]